MVYLYKGDLTRAKEMNQKCREAGVIALDCEGNDSDMYGWPDTFYLYFPTEESIKLFNDLSDFDLFIDRIGLHIVHNDHGVFCIPVDYYAAQFKTFMQNKNRGKTKQLMMVENFKEEESAAV